MSAETILEVLPKIEAIPLYSKTLGKLFTALSKAQGEFPTIKKNAKNPFFKSKYVTLDQLIKHTAPVLSKHNLAVCQVVEDTGEHMWVKTILGLGGTEEWLCSRMAIKKKIAKIDGQRNKIFKELTPQEKGSEITYAQRYTYAAILSISASDDDDVELSMKENYREPPKKKIAKITQRDLEQLEGEIAGNEIVLDTILHNLKIQMLADMPESKFSQAIQLARRAQQKG